MSATDAAAARTTKLMTVYSAIVRAGAEGCTCHEIEGDYGILHQTASARITELVEGNHVRDSGRTRETPSRRSATVWVATQMPAETQDTYDRGLHEAFATVPE